MTVTIPKFPHGPVRILALRQAEISNFKVYLGELKLAEDHNPPIANSVATAPVQSQLKPEAEPSLAEAQPELPSDGSHISANSGSG